MADGAVTVEVGDTPMVQVGVLHMDVERLASVADSLWRSWGQLFYSPYVRVMADLHVGKSTAETDLHLLTSYFNDKGGLVVPCGALDDVDDFVARRSVLGLESSTKNWPLFVGVGYSSFGVERMRSYNYEIARALGEMAKEGPVEVAGSVWSLRQLGIEVHQSRGDYGIGTVRQGYMSVLQNVYAAAGLDEAWDSAQYVINKLFDTYTVPFSAPSDWASSDGELQQKITDDIARLMTEGQGKDREELAVQVVKMSSWEHHMLAVRILLRTLDLHDWRIAPEGDYENKKLSRDQLFILVKALRRCSHAIPPHVRLQVNRAGEEPEMTRFHYDDSEEKFYKLSPEPRLSESGFYVTYIPWQMWVYLILGVAILIVYFAVRVPDAPLEDVLQTLMSILILYISVPGTFLMKTVFKGERLSDVLRSRRNIDTSKEYNKLGTEDQWKAVVAMAAGIRGEAQNISRFRSGSAITGSSWKGWAALPSRLIARDAAYLGYTFGISKSGDLCYVRFDTREYFVVREMEDGWSLRITDRKAADPKIFDFQYPGTINFDERLSLLELPDRIINDAELD